MNGGFRNADRSWLLQLPNLCESRWFLQNKRERHYQARQTWLKTKMASRFESEAQYRRLVRDLSQTYSSARIPRFSSTSTPSPHLAEKVEPSECWIGDETGVAVTRSEARNGP